MDLQLGKDAFLFVIRTSSGRAVMVLRDVWYAVAWDHEIKYAPFGRTVCGEPIVLYRQTNGALSAFEDCCPHRPLSLSQGYLKGDHLVCKYRGLEFDECGECVWMPGQQGIHKDAKDTDLSSG
jgi:vanillate monooxygenase